VTLKVDSDGADDTKCGRAFQARAGMSFVSYMLFVVLGITWKIRPTYDTAVGVSAFFVYSIKC